eukprot:499600-Prymnesium_polylepis.1
MPYTGGAAYTAPLTSTGARRAHPAAKLAARVEAAAKPARIKAAAAVHCERKARVLSPERAHQHWFLAPRARGRQDVETPPGASRQPHSQPKPPAGSA